MQLSIHPFRPEDQEEVKGLILAGLAERWGTLDPEKNADLQDIASSYANACFLVARVDGQVAAVGALVPRSLDTAEIVRMSVAARLRKQGLGRLILQRLMSHARELGCRRVVLETTSTWEDAVRFYQAAGFQITHQQDGNTYFSLDLS